jgi:ketosteroid isomerase-like protein
MGVAGGPPAIRRIKYLDILRKQADGTWKIAIHGWGANKPSAP